METPDPTTNVTEPVPHPFSSVDALFKRGRAREWLGIPESSLKRLVASGQIAEIVVGSHSHRIALSELQRYAASRRVIKTNAAN